MAKRTRKPTGARARGGGAASEILRANLVTQANSPAKAEPSIRDDGASSADEWRADQDHILSLYLDVALFNPPEKYNRFRFDERSRIEILDAVRNLSRAVQRAGVVDQLAQGNIVAGPWGSRVTP